MTVTDAELELIDEGLEAAGRGERIDVRRIRYYAYFRIVDGGMRVEILAVWHGSRGSGPRL